MNSIRGRLLLILLTATGLVWLTAVLWIQHATRAEVIHVLDRRLEESARMVASLIGSGGLAPDGPLDVPLGSTHPMELRHQLSCQVWGLDGRFISGSAAAPDGSLSDGTAGFSENEVGGERWRVFTHIDEASGVRVMVGDAQAMRDHLVRGVTLALLVPALLVLPLLGGLIWWTVGRGLRPLDRLGEALHARPADDLSPIRAPDMPRELAPMVGALNALLRRVGLAREHERSFTAFAAHELKTPLAGLKTQAEIASLAPDAPTRQHALDQIARGVQRTDRMVKQLLEMTSVETAPSISDAARDGALLLSEVVADLAALAGPRGVTVRMQAREGLWQAQSPTLLRAALRNLVENAIQVSPAGASVDVSLHEDGGQMRYRVADRGPGILPQDRAHVTQRFYRSTASTGDGSGLGLSIVAVAMERMGGTLVLSPRSGGGECAELVLPSS